LKNEKKKQKGGKKKRKRKKDSGPGPAQKMEGGRKRTVDVDKHQTEKWSVLSMIPSISLWEEKKKRRGGGKKKRRKGEGTKSRNVAFRKNSPLFNSRLLRGEKKKGGEEKRKGRGGGERAEKSDLHDPEGSFFIHH